MTADLVLRLEGLPELRQHSPADDWPPEALALARELAEHYPDGDPLPATAGAWIARQRSANTRCAYARQLRTWEAYARACGVHPLRADFPLAEAFSRHLETVPTLRPVKGGRRGETSPTGPPRSDASRASVLSACSSFHTYAVRARKTQADPFALVRRPDTDPDYSPTQGSTEEETAALLAAARADSPRSYALCMALYTVCLRVDSALGARVEHLGYDKGHRVLKVRLKGGRWKAKAVPPATAHAIDLYLDGRSEGWLFRTASGGPLDPSYVWRLVRRLARAAGLPHAETFHPHGFKHDAVTHALDRPGSKLHEVQDFADHMDPRTTRRYDRRRGRLDGSPAYGLAARVTELMGAEG